MLKPIPTSEDFDLAGIGQLTGTNTLHFATSMSSTSDIARKMLTDESPELPMLVLTNNQTAGRGQGDRSWWAGEGALTFSWVSSCGLRSNLQLLSLAAAMAVVTAIESLVENLHPKIKWPNDVYVDRKKIAGILIESVVLDNVRCFIFGIGVNANNSLTGAPPEIKDIATSLMDVLVRPVNLNRLLITIIVQLHAFSLLAADDPSEISNACLDRLLWRIGDRLGVRTPAGKVQGTFAGFGLGGQLLIRTSGSVEQIVSGTIVEF